MDRVFTSQKNVDIPITLGVNSESVNNLEKDIAFKELFVEYVATHSSYT